MTPQKPWRGFLSIAVVVGLIDVTVLVLAIAWATRVGYVAQIFGGAVGIISVVTFVGFFKEFATDGSGRMRAAITASFLMVYLCIFGLVAFSPQLQGLVRGEYGTKEPATLPSRAEGGTGTDAPEAGDDSDGEKQDDQTVAEDLFDSLSGVVTAIVAFYFGGAAVEGAAARLAGGPAESEAQGAMP
ncbi:MAG: hypothetical protein M3N32_08375 [Actinomycetota bacterium]|nr:hypothetical protein [Actinomycetota bacterium]